MRTTRRTLLELAALSTVRLAFGQGSAAPTLTYPTDPRHRIAVSTYPFRANIVSPRNTDRVAGAPGMDLAAFARYIRKEFNVFGIEPLHSHFASTELEAIHRLKASFDTAGVRTVNIAVDEDVNLTTPDDERRTSFYSTLEHWIDIAVILQAPSIRIGAIPHGTGPADITGPVDALKPLLGYAAQHNVIVCLENDDPQFGSAARIAAMIDLANSPWLRGLPDFANGLIGGDEAFNTAAVRTMFRYAADIAHVKDAEVITGQRRTVSLATLFGIAREAGYRGYYAMESDSGIDPAADTKHLIERCLALM